MLGIKTQGPLGPCVFLLLQDVGFIFRVCSHGYHDHHARSDYGRWSDLTVPQ